MKRAPRKNAASIAGLTKLMNPQHMKDDLNLDQIEQKVMGKYRNESVQENTTDVEQSYLSEIDKLASELGIDLSESTPASPPKKSSSFEVDKLNFGSKSSDDSGSDDEGEGDDEKSSEEDTDEAHADSDGRPERADGGGRSEDGRTNRYEDGRTNRYEDTESTDVVYNLEKTLGLTKKIKPTNHNVSNYPLPGKRNFTEIVTEEQEKRRHINSVISEVRGETRTSFGVEKERIQDAKGSKIEQIGQLLTVLEEDGIDCTGINSALTIDSPINEIDSVLNILKLKNDRNRYSSLGEEIITGMAECIEAVFDGSREIPIVGWRPDFTGYNNTLSVKLHRMRFETSQVVGSVIEKYNIGASTRIFMELLPSLFLYPRQQRRQRGSPGLSSEPYMSDSKRAMNVIRESDAKKSLDDARRI